MDSEHKHWAEALCEKMLLAGKEKYVVTAGMTTSGPCHLGTLCEFLYPHIIAGQLRSQGAQADFRFIADILDAFDSVPLQFEKYRASLEPHLGKPLCDVPDPTGEASSFGEHFLSETQSIMEKFGISPKIERANGLYASGAFDKYARLFLSREEAARRIVAETSGKQELPPDWSPIMPICARCGKISTTRVTWHDGENYKYACDRDVQYTRGCGATGENSIRERRYKLTWRLHWPSWMDHFGTDIEGAGVDHHTKGGSWDTVIGVFRGIFGKPPPQAFKFGFILLGGKKYSKSKGVGMGVSDLLSLLPPEVIKYMLVRPDLDENIDIVPSPQNFLRVISDFEATARLISQKAPVASLPRAARKKLVAFRLCTGKMRWSAQFTDVILYWQLYGDFAHAASALGDSEGVEFLRPYLLLWEARGLIPEEYLSKPNPTPPTHPAAIEFASKLSDSQTAEEIHGMVFEIASRHSIEPALLFELLYQSILGKSRGPKLGKLVRAIGPQGLKKQMLSQ